MHVPVTRSIYDRDLLGSETEITFTLNSKVLTTIYVVSKNMKISVIFVLVLACLMVLTEALPHRYHGSRYGNRRHRNRRPGRNNFGQGLGISQSSLKQ